LLKKIIFFKKKFINIDSNIFIYSENKTIFIVSYLGMLKIKIPEFLFFLKIEKIITIKNTYKYFSYKKKKNYNIINYAINKFFKLFKNLTIGFIAKFKVIGLGHKILYSKSNYLLKLGYSHLIYIFIPLSIASKKKKKKKYLKLISINSTIVNNLFFFLGNLRIPDIFSMNGIFNRNFFMQFKQGKKSFLL
jgi:ribosomal protein L6P/L9E